MTVPTKYDIVQLDGTTKEMTAAEIAEVTGLRVGTIRKRLSEQGQRSMERLSESPAAALKRGRQRFLSQSTAHFGEEKRIRAAEAAHPRKPWREFKER